MIHIIFIVILRVLETLFLQKLIRDRLTMILKTN